MITRLTKIQLVIFAFITVFGAAYVGGRYAQIDRLFVDRTYPVVAEFTESGGIFAGAEVTYRGVGVGRVGEVSFDEGGVVTRLDIENSAPKIPSDTEAIVANKSAVGEQFVDLQPRTKEGPFLTAESTITRANTKVPLDTSTVLIDLNKLVTSVDPESLKTVVNEFGAAFDGSGRDLTRIVETSNEFIETASDNLDVTREVIRNSGGVLQTQIDKGDEIRNFSENLALFSDTLADSDPDLERLLDGGAPAAKEVRQVLDANDEDLGALFSNLRVGSKPLADNADGLRALLLLFPYIVEGSFSVVSPDGAGNFDAHFGLVGLPPEGIEPAVCNRDEGYESVPKREPSDLSERDFKTEVDCTNDAKVPRQAKKTVFEGDPGFDDGSNRAAVPGNYDDDVRKVKATGQLVRESEFSVTPSQSTGKDSWKWLLLGPTAAK